MSQCNGFVEASVVVMPSWNSTLVQGSDTLVHVGAGDGRVLGIWVGCVVSVL